MHWILPAESESMFNTAEQLDLITLLFHLHDLDCAIAELSRECVVDLGAREEERLCFW